MLLLLSLSPLALAQQESTINGSLVDATGASVAHAQVRLLLEGGTPDREIESQERGEFTFSNVTPGPYRVSVNARGFAAKVIAGDLGAGETLTLPQTILLVDNLAFEVTVTQTQAELAEAQIKIEETQRLLGVVPNFFTSYDHDAAPLTAKQKLKLSGKMWLDPSSFVIGGIIAGVGQVQDTHKGFGQGAQGYAKRYGASFANYGTMLLLEKVVTPSLFRQDPRYFYKGTGTKTSRAFYAISRTFVCRGDNKKDQFCYSSLVNRFSTGFITNYYYPAADRDQAGVILRNSAMGFGFEALGNIFQEFVARKITRGKH